MSVRLFNFLTPHLLRIGNSLNCLFWRLSWRLSLLALVAAISPTAQADWELNMPVGVTSQSQAIYGLHMLIFWICVAISVIVYAVMGYAMIAYRRSVRKEAAQFSHHTRLEIVWTVAAALVLFVLAIPSTKVLIDIYDQSPGDINIKVVGYQWKWGYEYLEEGFSFISNLSTSQDEISGRSAKGEFYLLDVDKPVYIPVGKRVRFLITAKDVLHAFWIPDFGIKQDAIPGYFNIAQATVQEPGVYRGVCAELCGLNHGFMPITVVAVEEAEYRIWVEEQKAAFAEAQSASGRNWQEEELLEKGQQVYARNCAVCHQLDGKGVAGAFPALAGSPVVLGDRTNQTRLLLRGVPGTAMQAFGDILTATDIAAVLTYSRSAWGNDAKITTDRVIQPAEVLREKGN